ncbi:MAG: hypothetical protein OJF50_003079 [Nitrospira sp.]|nr:hypothetical protein [Nitrospira sp.]
MNSPLREMGQINRYIRIGSIWGRDVEREYSLGTENGSL